MKVILVAGARPNFMKIAPVMDAMERYNRSHGNYFEPYLVHTGQHYDVKMSSVFFADLGIPSPDENLEVGSGTHAEQTGAVMAAIEKVYLQQKPDLIMVVGDVNSTLAAAVAASKLCIPVAHIEAGLRSFDRTMPEEVNRVVTDVLSDILFTTDRIADENLEREGIAPEKVHFVGNVMIDALYSCMDKIDASSCSGDLGLKGSQYAVMTLHRAGNVDNKEILAGIFDIARELAEKIKVIFPCHPRTKARMCEFGLEGKGLEIIDPLGYLDFMSLVKRAKVVVSDSGGIQAESTVLGVPCITLRNTTEFPVTCTKGTNVLVGNDPERIRAEMLAALNGKGKEHNVPEYWDGKASERIVDILVGS